MKLLYTEVCEAVPNILLCKSPPCRDVKPPLLDPRAVAHCPTLLIFIPARHWQPKQFAFKPPIPHAWFQATIPSRYGMVTSFIGWKWTEFFPYRPVPFSTFSRPFPYLRNPVFIFAEVENGVFRSFPSNPVLIRNRSVFIPFLSRFQIYAQHVQQLHVLMLC
jgi:hypothetical protein